MKSKNVLLILVITKIVANARSQRPGPGVKIAWIREISKRIPAGAGMTRVVKKTGAARRRQSLEFRCSNAPRRFCILSLSRHSRESGDLRPGCCAFVMHSVLIFNILRGIKLFYWYEFLRNSRKNIDSNNFIVSN